MNGGNERFLENLTRVNAPICDRDEKRAGRIFLAVIAIWYVCGLAAFAVLVTGGL